MKLILILLLGSYSLFALPPEVLKSKQIFTQAIFKRSLYLSSLEACGGEVLPWRIICLEGYHFQDTLMQIQSQPQLSYVWAYPLASDPIRSLAIGMAYGYLNRTLPNSYLFQGKQTHYAIDGWAFLQSSLRPELHPELCSTYIVPAPFNEYCLFGQGRAHLFLGTGSKRSFEKQELYGRLYAGAIHGDSGMDIPGTIKKIVELQFSGISNSQLGDCLRKNHHLDCVNE